MNPSETAKAIKKELKKKFPEVKFSVRCGSGSAWATIYINWDFGPESASQSRNPAKKEQ